VRTQAWWWPVSYGHRRQSTHRVKTWFCPARASSTARTRICPARSAARESSDERTALSDRAFGIANRCLKFSKCLLFLKIFYVSGLPWRASCPSSNKHRGPPKPFRSARHPSASPLEGHKPETTTQPGGLGCSYSPWTPVPACWHPPWGCRSLP